MSLRETFLNSGVLISAACGIDEMAFRHWKYSMI